jgi:plasmid stabilization system protein ParE
VRRVRFHTEAASELESAIDYLSAIAPALAERFAIEVERALEQIREFPQMGGRTLGAGRRWFVRRFNYELIYREADDCIFVLAVAHERRAPGYWISRDERGREVHETATHDEAKAESNSLLFSWLVRRASYRGGLRIWLEFEDGVTGEVDLESELYGAVFESLRDPEQFRQFRLDTEIDTIAWPNGADFAPELLHDLVARGASEFAEP